MPDGLCFVHAVVCTLLVHHLSDGRFGEKMIPIIETIRSLMPNKTLICDLDELEFIQMNGGTLQGLLCGNAKYIQSLVYNITVAMVHSWTSSELMDIIRYRLLVNGRSDLDPLDLDTCDFRQNLNITTEKRFEIDEKAGTVTEVTVVDENSIISAVDGIGRLFVMSILGVTKIKVHQLANLISLGRRVENVERYDDSIYHLKTYTRSEESSTLGGYFLELDDAQMLMPDHTGHVTMGIHSLRSHHYDMFVAYRHEIPSVPCYPLGVEIPPPTVCPPIENIRLSLERRPIVTIQQIMY
jgi:hypothetical protein